MRKHIWKPLPATESLRLSNLLQTHLHDSNIKVSTQARRDFVEALLSKQNYTCAFDNGHGCCWNHPKNVALKYLKLEWGHKIPRSFGHTTSIDEFYLLCARCNNHLQSSRTLEELKYELEEKLKVLNIIMSTP